MTVPPAGRHGDHGRKFVTLHATRAVSRVLQIAAAVKQALKRDVFIESPLVNDFSVSFVLYMFHYASRRASRNSRRRSSDCPASLGCL